MGLGWRVGVRVRVRVRIRGGVRVRVGVCDLLHGADERDRLCEVRVGALLAARHDQHALHLGRDGVRMRSKG